MVREDDHDLAVITTTNRSPLTIHHLTIFPNIALELPAAAIYNPQHNGPVAALAADGGLPPHASAGATPT